MKRDKIHKNLNDIAPNLRVSKSFCKAYRTSRDNFEGMIPIKPIFILALSTNYLCDLNSLEVYNSIKIEFIKKIEAIVGGF